MLVSCTPSILKIQTLVETFAEGLRRAPRYAVPSEPSSLWHVAFSAYCSTRSSIFLVFAALLVPSVRDVRRTNDQSEDQTNHRDRKLFQL